MAYQQPGSGSQSALSFLLKKAEFTLRTWPQDSAGEVITRDGVMKNHELCMRRANNEHPGPAWAEWNTWRAEI